jgi:hypothetical protein
MESSLWGTKLYLNMTHLESMGLGGKVTADLTAG